MILCVHLFFHVRISTRCLTSSQKMVEKYNRNVAKPANEDVSELVFLINEEKIQITYHTEDDKVSACTREYIKPQNADEKGATLQLSSDMHSTFQVGENSKKRCY